MAGPYNSYEVELNEQRLNLGSIWIPTTAGLDVSAELDQSTGKLISVSLIYASSIAAIQIFAAAKDHDSWSEVRYEIASRLEETKVQPKIVNGIFGPEIHAVMPTYEKDGTVTIQAVRFIGINGDRWFMRIAISGEGATDETASQKIDQIISSLVINRGDEAMAPGATLPLTFPESQEINQDRSAPSIHIEI